MSIDILWTRTAEIDLTDIVDYIAADAPQTAARVLRTLQRRAQTLADQPGRGRVVSELRAVDVRQYRGVIERPWRLIYRAQSSRAIVMAVLEGWRDLESLLLDRLLRD